MLILHVRGPSRAHMTDGHSPCPTVALFRVSHFPSFCRFFGFRPSTRYSFYYGDRGKRFTRSAPVTKRRVTSSMDFLDRVNYIEKVRVALQCDEVKRIKIKRLQRRQRHERNFFKRLREKRFRVSTL